VAAGDCYRLAPAAGRIVLGGTLVRIRYFFLIGVAVIGALAAVWHAWRPVVVESPPPRRGDVAEIVYASGVVEPRLWAKVTSLVRERIVEQCNCEAEKVEQGAVLAKMDDSEAKAALSDLEARSRLARENLSRLTTLVEKNAASQQALDQARADAAQMEAQIAGQKSKLDSYFLRAPSAGTVLRKDAEVGEIADAGAVLFWVGQPKPLLVVADVNEEDIPRVDLAQRVLLRADAFPDRALEGTVDSITPKGDPVTKTYRVRIKLPDDTPLRIGMSTDVNIVTRVAKNALLVPSIAMRGSTLFIVENGKARLRKVEVGIRGISEVEVLSGLSEDARVISPFPESLADGARVSAGKE
jgi:membrane fusion protein (multidrug efflux system)